MNYKFRNIIFLVIAIVLGLIVGYYFPHRVSCNNSYSGENNQLCQVVDVIDGDTIRARIGNKVEIIRLLGINTPEVNNPYRKQECFGPEASVETKKLLKNKKVYVIPDPEAPNRGKYHRLLRYIFLPNGEFVNADLIKNGYAFSYIYQPIQFMDFFNSLEYKARENRLGIWSNKCDYYSRFKKSGKM